MSAILPVQALASFSHVLNFLLPCVLHPNGQLVIWTSGGCIL